MAVEIPTRPETPDGKTAGLMPEPPGGKQGAASLIDLGKTDHTRKGRNLVPDKNLSMVLDGQTLRELLRTANRVKKEAGVTGILTVTASLLEDSQENPDPLQEKTADKDLSSLSPRPSP